MRKFLFLAILFYAIACNSSDNNEGGSDSILNSPPGFTTDTSAGARMDTSEVTDSLGTGTGTNRTGQDSAR